MRYQKMISGIKKLLDLWQRYKIWKIDRQSKKFAEELKKKNYKPREPWDVGIWK